MYVIIKNENILKKMRTFFFGKTRGKIENTIMPLHFSLYRSCVEQSSRKTFLQIYLLNRGVYNYKICTSILCYTVRILLLYPHTFHTFLQHIT